MKSETEHTPQRLIRIAAGKVRQALDTWQATDLNRVAGSQTLLQNAVEDLQFAIAAIDRYPVNQRGELRAEIAALRVDLTRITRVVDACVAFQNGLAVRLGARGVVYQPSGSAVPALLSPRPQGIEA